MKYLSTYKLFESISLESEIREIFLSVSDLTYIKFVPFIQDVKNFTKDHSFYKLEDHVSVSIGFTKVTPGESGTSKWGVKYREIIKGDVIAEEIANSISICFGMGFKITRAEVSWVNAGEWKLSNPDKEGTGPGILTKIFEGKKIGPIDMVDKNAVKTRYSPEMLPDFIIDKGTRLRHIILTFIS